MKKMNISISMGFLKPVTNFFKKYSALLPSIGITVFALLVLLPTMLVIGRSVKKEMSGSVSTATSVTSLLRDVPSKDTPQQVKRYMDRFEEETTQIETLAAESSMRELISYDIFPPKGTSSQLYTAFGKKYQAAVEKMVDAMNALDAPNDAEVRNQTGNAGGGAGAGMEEYRRRERDITVNPMVEALCLKRAQEIAVYAHPSAFLWYDFWENYEFAGQQQALEDCWDSQVAFWIYEDIAQTISNMNEGSDKVSSSPVKRLLGVSFSGPVDSGRSGDAYSRSRSTSTASRDKPNYIISSPASMASTRSPGTGNITMMSNFVSASLTKRSGDEDVDVIHFTFSVLVDNRYVLAFMKELCSEKSHVYRVGFKENGEEKNAVHNQITILDTKISAVDKEAPEHELYRYGNGAVMQLDLICEYQFYRKGYDDIKPEPVKKALGQLEEQEQTTTGSRTPRSSRNRRDR